MPTTRGLAGSQVRPGRAASLRGQDVTRSGPEDGSEVRVARPSRAQTGRLGEDLAARWAVEQGWRVVDRNWRHGRSGELDLVALDGDELVAVEVKTRRGHGYGHPAEAVTSAKVARLRLLTAAWLATHELRPGSVRIDVLAVTLPPGGDPRIEHLRVVG